MKVCQLPVPTSMQYFMIPRSSTLYVRRSTLKLYGRGFLCARFVADSPTVSESFQPLLFATKPKH